MPQKSAPKLSDKCVNWPGYYDVSTSHNNNLGNVKCSDFLKESMPTGRDDDIRQMQRKETNYAVAWGLMIERYKNPWRIT